jgi:hypothetical protein
MGRAGSALDLQKQKEQVWSSGDGDVAREWKDELYVFSSTDP